MVPHTRRRGIRRLASIPALLTSLAVIALVSGCDKVPLLAPAGSVITIFPANTTVPINGEVEIVATVIENGTVSSGTGTTTPTSTKAAGTPVQNGTLVSFTTTMGRIEPTEARTHNGEVHVKFIAGAASGTAKITAYSGGAVATLDNLLVGTAAAERIIVTAVTQTLPASGGSTEIRARVENAAGVPIPNIPVTFTTDAGTLSATSASTDAEGIARTTLTSTAAATVTAAAGSKTGTVKVGIATRSGLAVSASTNTPKVGEPVTFTITTTAGQAVTNAVINYGDGQSRNLGTITTSRTDTHTYQRAGNFPVTVTADNGESAGTSLSVGTLPVTLTGTSPTLFGNPTTFTVNGTTNAQVDHYEFNYDDGVVNRTNGPSDSHVFSSRGTHTARVDVFGVGNVLLGQATASVIIQ